MSRWNKKLLQKLTTRLPKRLEIEPTLTAVRKIFSNPDIVLSFKNMLGVSAEKVSEAAKPGIDVET